MHIICHSNVWTPFPSPSTQVLHSQLPSSLFIMSLDKLTLYLPYVLIFFFSSAVDITLNPFNLTLNLVLSEDQRQVLSVPIWPVKYYNYGILGSQYFSSGKHYWEIDVSKKTAWILGVYCRIRSCNRKFAVQQSTSYENAYSIYRPQFGYWVIGLKDKFRYEAFEDSSTTHPDSRVLTLFMTVPPCHVGVFLDYEAGTVSFFNVTNHGSLIYKFSKCNFSRNAYPYFNPWDCPAPMTLCPPSSWNFCSLSHFL